MFIQKQWMLILISKLTAGVTIIWLATCVGVSCCDSEVSGWLSSLSWYRSSPSGDIAFISSSAFRWYPGKLYGGTSSGSGWESFSVQSETYGILKGILKRVELCYLWQVGFMLLRMFVALVTASSRAWWISIIQRFVVRAVAIAMWHVVSCGQSPKRVSEAMPIFKRFLTSFTLILFSFKYC